MVERFLGDKIALHAGDCLDVLARLEENSIDSCVTDPPYHLTSIVKRFGADNAAPAKPMKSGDKAFQRLSGGFMGKVWDGGDVAFRPETWAAVYRVLKPGAHLIAMGGTRTYHRLACAIEDAGFEIRDTVSWLYGSGFPKSHDVSKGIDKANGKHERNLMPFGAYIRELREAKGWSLRALDEAMGTNTAASWWEGRKAGVQPPGIEQYRKLKSILDMDDRFDELIEWLEAEREVTGRATDGSGNGCVVGLGTTGNLQKEYDLTAPATDAAREWQGWGTSLKPAQELIVLARKPLSEGTVAANVLRWGCGAINVDGCRVGTDIPRPHIERRNDKSLDGNVYGSGINGSRHLGETTTGRWPANVVHDGSDEVVAAFPESNSARASGNPNNPWRGTNHTATSYGQGDGKETVDYRDQGSAARFFFTSKADADDRLGSKHPTVKPLDLMQWLVRLVTPKNGTVLDCFAGTGTTGEAAWREGMRAVLIEREAEYQADCRRRMALALSGPDERGRESVKARGMPIDYGPLFGGIQEAAE